MTQEFLYNEKLYGLEKEFLELLYLYENNNLPNKILFSGLKGSGKCTLAYHLINCILSSFDNIKYDKKKFLINKRSNKVIRIQKSNLITEYFQYCNQKYLK